MMPDETLQYIADKVPLEINFIEGVNPIKKLDTPFNDVLLSIKGHDVKSTAKIENVKVNGKIPSQKVDALVDDFIDIVGPLGAAISDSVLSRLGYAKGSGMSGDNYSVLLSSCLEELPEDERKQFKVRHV
jgi:hypothetical protein